MNHVDWNAIPSGKYWWCCLVVVVVVVAVVHCALHYITYLYIGKVHDDFSSSVRFGICLPFTKKKHTLLTKKRTESFHICAVVGFVFAFFCLLLYWIAATSAKFNWNQKIIPILLFFVYVWCSCRPTKTMTNNKKIKIHETKQKKTWDTTFQIENEFWLLSKNQIINYLHAFSPKFMPIAKKKTKIIHIASISPFSMKINLLSITNLQHVLFRRWSVQIDRRGRRATEPQKKKLSFFSKMKTTYNEKFQWASSESGKRARDRPVVVANARFTRIKKLNLC